VAAVWYGNDDFSPSKELTGGILPAMTWKRLMTYAHQNIDLKPIPGLPEPFMAKPDAGAEVAKATEEAEPDEILQRKRPINLNPKTQNELLKLRDAFRSAPVLIAPEVQSVSSIDR
jgi:penicillin-binding protein 1A